ncbi:MAG: O-antigen ligase family protein [Proteobacteria bacterium]|nr:O-antigen ligase family protein [Pseudomonadota bacterium]
MTSSAISVPPYLSWFSMDRLRAFLVAMIFISSFYVKFEPAPPDLFFLIAFLACIGGGLRFSPAIFPLFLMLLIYNLACLVSWLLVPYDVLEGEQFLIGLAYTTASGFFFAAYLSADPMPRYRLIIKAYWIGATIGAILGLYSYIVPFNTLLPAFGGRALGGYKDPNVYSTWLVLPAVTLLQALVIGTVKPRLITVLSCLAIFAALFLAFSRGAWINAIVATAITVTLSFALSPSQQLRLRVISASVLGVIACAVGLIILLSIPQTRDLFLDRFTLVKNYDAGETGRFGNQLNSIPMLMGLPFGFGPYQFGGIFGLAPHNTFLNSFASGGWVGGVVFLLFTLSNFIIGFKTIVVRSPFQPQSIAVFACLIGVTIQGIQIDMEHWRHFYWMTGILWGFFAATYDYGRRPATPAEIAEAWNSPVARGASR